MQGVQTPERFELPQRPASPQIYPQLWMQSVSLSVDLRSSSAHTRRLVAPPPLDEPSSSMSSSLERTAEGRPRGALKAHCRAQKGRSHLSVPADLDLLAVVPGVQDVLGAVEGDALLLEPLHGEDPSQTQHVPVLAALLTDDRGHASVALQKHTARRLERRVFCRKVALLAAPLPGSDRNPEQRR